MPNRTDDNQAEILRALKQIGADWIPTTGDPNIGCDLIVLWRGRSLLCEIKDGDKPPSRRKLTDSEVKRQAQCAAKGVPYLILLSAQQAIEVLGEFR